MCLAWTHVCLAIKYLRKLTKSSNAKLVVSTAKAVILYNSAYHTTQH